jgi:hypothetical protein
VWSISLFSALPLIFWHKAFCLVFASLTTQPSVLVSLVMDFSCLRSSCCQQSVNI